MKGAKSKNIQMWKAVIPRQGGDDTMVKVSQELPCAWYRETCCVELAPCTQWGSAVVVEEVEEAMEDPVCERKFVCQR